jgi:hypothetical protein
MTGGGPLDGSGSGSLSIPEIVEMAGQGRIRVPTFQRHFAWRAEDVRQLFDSLYRGFPVGTLLLWRHEAPSGTVTLGPLHLEVPQRSDAYWVVDGQQRITSLFLALAPTSRNADDQFEIYFDLASQKFVNARGGAAPPRAIPVRQALETRTLLQWLRRNADMLEQEDLDLADRLGGALRDYRIPAYIVAGNDQDLLREVFDRVNSAGKPISRAQVFHALFGGVDEPGSPASVVAELAKLGFGELDEGRVVQSLLALRGGDVQRDIRTEFLPAERLADWYDATADALKHAIGFLRDEGVLHQLLMPTTLPLPVLAAFFHLHPNPEPHNKRLLARWLWRGWVHGFGREGGQTPVLRRAIRSVNPGFREPEAAPSEYAAVHALLDFAQDRPVPELDLDRFNTKNASARLILLAMASLRPLDRSGSRIDIARQLESYGSEAVTQLAPGRRSKAGARSFWPADSTPITEVDDARVLATHLMDEESQHLLRDLAFDEFVIARTRALDDLVRRFLDSRLEPGVRPRPPLNQIASGDLDGDE